MTGATGEGRPGIFFIHHTLTTTLSPILLRPLEGGITHSDSARAVANCQRLPALSSSIADAVDSDDRRLEADGRENIDNNDGGAVGEDRHGGNGAVDRYGRGGDDGGGLRAGGGGEEGEGEGAELHFGDSGDYGLGMC